jgi:uncharacterized protein with FMN-binding domain
VELRFEVKFIWLSSPHAKIFFKYLETARWKEASMQKRHPQPGFDLGRAIKKFFLSGFVVFAFVAYVIHERLTNPDASLTDLPATPIIAPTQDTSSVPQTAPLAPSAVPQASSPLPTDTPQASSLPATTSQGLYKDGTFKGPEVDAYYGLVQVQATIHSGKIASVQFLEYPSDRHTSVEINNIAVPYLQQEAVQAQSASVDIISGATLTSEAFMMSLQNALNSAKN